MVRFYIACSCMVFFLGLAAPAGAQTFQSLPVDLVATDRGRIKWIDLDNDNDLDLLYCGTSTNGTLDFRTLVYENVAGAFVARTTALPRLWGHGLIPGDFDNDGDYDILVTGIGPEPTPWTQYSNTTQLYENRGGFTFVLKQSFYGLNNSTALWIDLEMDGDLDLIVTGVDDTRDDVPMINETFVYENTGGTFTPLTNTGIGGCGQCFMECADSDGDGDLDLLMTGLGPNDFSKTSLYINNGDKTFHEDTSIPIIDLVNGDNHWGDFDNDGDQDILICGGDWSPDDIDGVYTGVFENTPSGFVERTDIKLHQFGNAWSGGIIGWADLDNDGYLDIAVSGLDNVYLYRNNQHGGFEPLAGSVFEKVANASIDFGDFDNDGDLDIAYIGQSQINPFGPVAGIYENRLYDAPATSNTRPSPPQANTLSEYFLEKDVRLSWARGSDAQTPAAGLGYNYYIRSATQKITTPPVDYATGFLRTDNAVNANSMIARLTLEGEGTFYWAVQSVDGNGVGSVFTPEKTFYKLNSPRTVAAEILDPGHIKLSWTVNSHIAQGNAISRSLKQSSDYTPLVTVAAAVETHIDAYVFATDTYYYYRIHAVNNDHASSYDSLKVVIPTAPANLTATGGGTVDLQWEDRSAYETGYVVERRAAGEDTFTSFPPLNAGSTHYADTEAAETMEYVYRVRAINEYGSSAYSNEVTVKANSRPVGENIERILEEDATLHFTQNDFTSNFSDTDADDVLDHIVIQTLPSSGTLYRGENKVVVGESMAVADLDALSFTPRLDMYGEVSFTCWMSDGRSNTLDPIKVTLIVTPVNDPPVLSVFPDVKAQQGPAQIIGFTVSDVDDPVSSLVITATSSHTDLIKSERITFSKNAPRLMTIIPEKGKAGNAVITVTVSDGKASTAGTCNVTILPAVVTDVEDPRGSGAVQVYPNPVITTLTVVTPGVPLQRAVATLVDAFGSEVRRQPLEDEGVLALEDLAPGVYLLRIWQDDTLLHQRRIVKQ